MKLQDLIELREKLPKSLDNWTEKHTTEYFTAYETILEQMGLYDHELTFLLLIRNNEHTRFYIPLYSYARKLIKLIEEQNKIEQEITKQNAYEKQKTN